MATPWALLGNLTIACAYAAICMAILMPVVRAGQLRTNRLAVATALIFFSCAVGHAFHAAMYSDAALHPTGHHATAGRNLWPTAVWDLLTAAAGIYYLTLRRSYGILLGGTGALYLGTGEQQRRHATELRERVAEGRAEAEHLTEAMGGTIGVDSEPGQGSTFWCEIPFQPATGTTTDTTGLRILVIGTGPDRAALEDDLRRWHLHVTTADTAAAAIDALRAAATHGRPYDLLLLDADPGDVDTAGLARLVTADPAIPAVHIIVLNEQAPTGRPGDPSLTHLPRPVHRSTLYDVLARSMAAVVPVPVTSTAAPAGAAPAHRGTVLLVEDNDINQMVALGILTSLGYHADIAGDGRQACDMAARRDYDAILMDCRMPHMDGFAATAELRHREQPGDRHTPIIAMTASALIADRDRCLAAGMDDYLTKPVDRGELDDALHRWITDTPGAGRGTVTRDPTDPIGARLDELAGDHTPAETALVQRLVTSFRNRAPKHAAALTAAYRTGDVAVVEDQAHSLKGAAGNIGAAAVMAVCQRLEDEARTGRLSGSTADDLRTLRLELERVDKRLGAVLSAA